MLKGLKEREHVQGIAKRVLGVGKSNDASLTTERTKFYTVSWLTVEHEEEVSRFNGL